MTVAPCPERNSRRRAARLGVWLLACALAVSGCVGALTGAERRGQAASIAEGGGLAPLALDTGPACRPHLAAFAKNGPGRTLTVYIEGDGQAYRDRVTPSDDPTPADPLALRLAALDPGPKILYLARPGQYLPENELSACDPALWTTARYSARVVDCLSAALDAAERTLGATQLRLVGYSGGGALAVLLAAKRTDVVGLVTMAANLDTDAWTAFHHVAPLTDSRNPAEAAAAVAGLPQVHYVGSDDRITPPWLCRHFLSRLPAEATARCLVIDGADHHHGLAEAWPDIVGGLPPADGSGRTDE